MSIRHTAPMPPARTHRLYCKGRILGHKRGKRNSRPNQSLVQIEGVDSAENARSYLGKVSHVLDLGEACRSMQEDAAKLEER